MILIHVSTIIPNDRGEILFVREAKEVHRGKWNLPGGHVEHMEHLTHAAMREVREETGLVVELLGVVNLISAIGALHSIRHTFLGRAEEPGRAAAGDEILEITWMPPETVIAMPDDALVGAPYLRSILKDYLSEKLYPLSVLREL
jgi:ADP-ribose pyrophosphatase YjhB (NUDIX family)